jgi:AraC-like DNA-binding protein
MPQPALTLSSVFVNAFLDASEVAADERPALLDQAGIPPGTLDTGCGRITESQFTALYRVLAVKFDDELPNLLSHPLRSGAMKLAGLCVIDAPTIEVVLNRYTRFQRLAMHDFEMHFCRGPELSALMIKEPASGRRCKTMGIEMNLKVVHGLVSWLAGREMPLVRVDFAFEKPAYAAELQNLFPGPVLFDQPCSQLLFESRLMCTRVQRNATDLRHFLSRLPHDWMFVPMKERLASHQIREYLLQHGMVRANVEQVAKELNVSVRTLSRRLEAESTTFQQVKDDVRRDIAIERLIRSDMPLAEIASELGFGDASSFHRAFRTWAGMTPSAYRHAGGAHRVAGA